MTADGRHSGSHTEERRRGDRRSSPALDARAPHRHRGGWLLPALAGAAFATALVAGCTTSGPEETGEETSTNGPEQTSEVTDPTQETTTEDGTADGDDGGEEDGTGGDDPEDDAPEDDNSDDTDGGGDEGGPEGEHLFEGSWSFGHDEKVLDAEELADLLEDEAESRGPEEMSLDVECADGVDTGIPDDAADCTAYADEGVEHVWLITVGPADAGLVIEVENAG